MSKTALAVLMFFCMAAFSVPMSAQLIPHGNVFAGVSYGQLTEVVNQQSYRGLEGTGEAFPFTRFAHLSLVLDASAYFRHDEFARVTEYNAMGGFRWSYTHGKFRPFAEILGGVQRISSSGLVYSHAVEGAGGGLDYKIPFKNFSWRFQGDYIRSNYASATQNDYRASTGLVWRF